MLKFFKVQKENLIKFRKRNATKNVSNGPLH